MKKGVGMPYYFQEDIDKLGDVWFYDWGANNRPSPYVPMSWGGEDPNLPLDYSDYVLLFNEPDRPDQSDITPELGVYIYRQFRKKYPLAKWVVGNVWYAAWLYRFRDLCEGIDVPTIWGLHSYVAYSEYLFKMTNYLDKAHDNLGGTFWMTEFSSVLGDVSLDEVLVKYFESRTWVERYAYFCNRASGTEPWYPPGWKVQLFDFQTGEPTDIGEWYIHGLHQTYIPIVERK